MARSLEASEDEAAGGDSPLAEVGGRIREIRGARGLTLMQLSQKSQVSVAMLSHIERCQTSPSLKTLDRIRRALEVPLAALFPAPDDPQQAARPVVVRQAERSKLDFEAIGLQKQLLSPPGASDLEVLMLVIAPQGGSGAEPWTRTGEKAGLVLSGAFELTVGDRTYALGAGDSFQFDSAQPHRFRNPSGREARVLWIIKSDAVG